MKPTKPAPLWLAVHEAGHAVARLVLDELYFPGPYLSSVTIIAEGTTLGHVRMQERMHTFLPVQPRFVAEQIRDAKLEVVEAMAGQIAEMRQRMGTYGPYFTRQEIVDLVMASDPDETHDFGKSRRFLNWLSPDDPRATMEGLYREALKLVEAEWTGIVAVARMLRQAGTMEGDEFEQVWRSGRKRRAKASPYLALQPVGSVAA